jgi:hypothetical protein
MPAVLHIYLNYTKYFSIENEHLSATTNYEVYRFKTSNCSILIHYSVRRIFTGFSAAAFLI